MVLDEAKIESRVREFVTRGFRVTLPRELQRSFALPTRYASAVDVLGRTLSVEIEATPPTLAPTGVWSAAQVRILAPGSKPAG